MKRGFLLAGFISLLAAGCYTGEEEPAPQLPSQDTNPPVTDQVAVGALVYDNWLSPLNGVGGEGLTSLGAYEPYPDYVLCVSCHGWDRLGQYGGIARKPRTLAQPNAGFGVDADPYAISRRLDGNSYTTTQITHNTVTGRMWSEGSAVYNDTDGPATGNRHPDYTQTLGLDSQQLANLSAFLSDTATGWNKVFSAINAGTDPANYTLVPDATSSTAALSGQYFYQSNCSNCHGANPSALAALLATDGGHSKFMFRSMWGSAEDANKTRGAMGSPGPVTVAGIMAYVNKFVAGNAVAGSPIWADYECDRCHGVTTPMADVNQLYANVMYLTKHTKKNAFASPRYLTEQEVANLRAYIRTL